MKKRVRLGIPISFFVILALAFVTVFSIIRGQTTIETEEAELSFSNLPDAFDGFRIAHLSDMHATRFGEKNAKLWEAVKGAKPDIIVITGDIAHDNGQEDYIKEAFLSLAAIAPTYYVSGNHEWAVYRLVPIIRDIAKNTGVVCLSNAYAALERGGERIYLAGIEDPNGPFDMESPEAVFDRIKEEAGESPFIITLYHRNNRLERFAESGVDLVLCGHAHGGVIRLPFTDGLLGPGRDLFPGYTAGSYTEGKTTMFVSRGLGVSATGETRVFNDPHLPVITLRKTGTGA